MPDGLWLTDDTARVFVENMRANILAAERGDLAFGNLDPVQAMRNNIDWLERQWHEQNGGVRVPKFTESTRSP